MKSSAQQINDVNEAVVLLTSLGSLVANRPAARGLKPNAIQCIGFSVPLVFGEGGTRDTPYVADLYDHLSFLGDLNRQIANLPKGAKVCS